jgi:hypothetical protein
MHSLPAEWLPVSMAPSDGDLEVCVLNYDGIVHALEFPCHKMEPNGAMLQIRSTSTFNRRIGANGLSAIKSKA